MRVIMIAALSADGYIAQKKEQVSTDWTTPEDKAFFVRMTKEAGVVVMGSTTYETFRKPLKDRRHIVLSSSKTFEGVEMSSESPRELVERLTQEGVTTLAVCGGSAVYTAFLEANLVDTLYLTIGNILFGDGVPFTRIQTPLRFDLVSSTLLGKNTVLLEYTPQRNHEHTH